MTMVPRTGPFSASSALATTSWYHLGKSSDWGVNTALAMGRRGYRQGVGTRVRFSPAPTGYLHVGGARTALFNWLYARHVGGTFVLRIEDTDVARSTQASVDQIQEVMRWVGLDWAEGPFLQSRRFDEYLVAAQQLLDQGSAYECFCTEG